MSASQFQTKNPTGKNFPSVTRSNRAGPHQEPMLSPRSLESYRQMTPAQRLRLTLDLSQSAWAAMLEGSADVVSRRFERLRQQNDDRNSRLCEAFRMSQQRMESNLGKSDCAGR